MLLLLSRPPRPDAPYWPGRRWLAVLDALDWPMVWILAVAFAPAPAGVVGWLVVALAACSALGRCRRAMLINHRYRFTTWRWSRAIAVLLAIGLVLKLTSPF